MPVLQLYEKVISNMSTVPILLGMTNVDVTIAYSPMDLLPPTMMQIFCLTQISPFFKFHIHVKRYHMNDVPLLTTSLMIVAS
jgi:hypothetical protein